jgi:hypothetical protein
MISLNLNDIPVYKPTAKPFDKHDCVERGCFIPSPQNGVSTENKAAQLVATMGGKASN